MMPDLRLIQGQSLAQAVGDQGEETAKARRKSWVWCSVVNGQGPLLCAGCSTMYETANGKQDRHALPRASPSGLGLSQRAVLPQMATLEPLHL